MLSCVKCNKFHLQCECIPPTIKLSSWPKPKTNQRGVTLVELLVVVAIIGILVPIMGQLFLNMNKMLIKTQQAQATIPKPRIVSITSNCTLLDGTFYGKTPDGNTLNIYTDSACTHSFGSLGRLSNEAWFNEATNSMWLTYSSTQLKLFVVHY